MYPASSCLCGSWNAFVDYLSSLLISAEHINYLVSGYLLISHTISLPTGEGPSLSLRVEGHLSLYEWRAISLLTGGRPSLSFGWRAISLFTSGGPSLSLRVEGHLSLSGGRASLSLRVEGLVSLRNIRYSTVMHLRHSSIR